MENKELFKIAIRYIDKGYSSDQLSDGDDLYSASKEDKIKCRQYYSDIKDNGLKWAYTHLTKM